jgi:hypothetical protein
MSVLANFALIRESFAHPATKSSTTAQVSGANLRHFNDAHLDA